MVKRLVFNVRLEGTDFIIETNVILKIDENLFKFCIFVKNFHLLSRC